MQFSSIIVALFAGIAAATPLVQERGFVCSNALDTPQCCSLTVDGIVGLTCEAPESSKSVYDFTESCASVGKEAQCCLAVLDGDGVDCNSP